MTLGDFTASVPNNAPYGSKEVLDITNLVVLDASGTPQPLPAAAADGIHVAAFFGDTNEDGTYDTPDVTLEQRVHRSDQQRVPELPAGGPDSTG